MPGGATRVLVTSFAPFGGAATNPSTAVAEELLRRFAGAAGAALHHRTLPVSFAGARAELTEAIAATSPAVVLSLGLAAGRTRPSFERLAVNLMDARIPDNDGAQPAGEPVVAGGPTALWTQLPVKAAVLEAERAGVEAELSMTAGTYVCNAVFYHAVHDLAGTGARAGFVHVPPCPTRAEVEARTDAVEILLRLTLAGATDPAVGVGATS